MSAAAILHVTSLFGGGVDRHVRDIVRGIPRPQLIWHAGDGVDVIEEASAGRFHCLGPLAFGARETLLVDWLRAQRIGLVHLHQLTRAPRERSAWAMRALGIPRVTTLHDILFLKAEAFAAADPLAPDPSWLADTSRILRDSSAVLAPSRWLAELAARQVPGLTVEVIPNGRSTAADDGASAAREAFASNRPGSVVALVGALGPHKGSDLVEEVAAGLEGTDIALVIIGYLDRQLHPGWRLPGRLFIHGAFAEGEAAGLLRGYGADLVLMPNTVPESFSYALSDAWAAGVPVLAAPSGALAERIATHGGGWLLPVGFDARRVAQEIRSLVGGDREPERARVQSQLAQANDARIPPLDAMIRSLDALYARFGVDPAAPETADEATLASLVAKNLDGSLFRVELVRLSDELAQTLQALETTRERAQAFETESRGWIAKLEADVAAVQDEIRAVMQERERLANEIHELSLYREAFESLPAPLKRFLLKRAADARR